jgi:hypothetical protein
MRKSAKFLLGGAGTLVAAVAATAGYILLDQGDQPAACNAAGRQQDVCRRSRKAA